jgi:hypothetical protein
MIKKLFLAIVYSIIAFAFVSYVSVMISLLSSVGDPKSKPETNIGFPFNYYFQFWVSGSDSPNCGWNLSNFIYDAFIILIIVLVIFFYIDRKKSKSLKQIWKKSKIPHKLSGLESNEIRKGTLEGLKKYDSLNFFEKYAMYMGVAQLLELRLKQILVNEFKEEFDKIENLPLGPTLKKLKEKGMRPDFFLFAEPVKNERNYIAHEIIANEAIWHALAGINPEHYTKDARKLDKAILEIEQLMFILVWNDQNGKWK